MRSASGTSLSGGNSLSVDAIDFIVIGVDPTGPEVVRAVRTILTILGIEHEAAAVNGGK